VRVALDATAVEARPSGARSRILSLYPLIARMSDMDLLVTVQSGSGLEEPFRESGAAVEVLRGPPPAWARMGRGLHGPAAMARSRACRLFAAETLPLPRTGAMPVVATVHDLRFFEPGLASWMRRLFAETLLRKNLERAARIVTVSAVMKEALLRRCPRLDPERIHVVPNGPPPLASLEKKAQENILAGLEVTDPLMLTLGHIEPRKNLEVLLEAFLRYRSSKEGQKRVSLILAGYRGTRYARRLVQTWSNRPGIRFLGQVTEEVRAALLGAARLAVQPSRYEGFGMGVLEAMAAGVPVACSKIPAHQEVLGETEGLLFPPDDAKALARTLARGLDDEGLRARLKEVGRDRAAAFSWAASAERLANIWRAIKE
jgi:alpha-1,3-rhamnosyl/mannosyltransferase